MSDTHLYWRPGQIREHDMNRLAVSVKKNNAERAYYWIKPSRQVCPKIAAFRENELLSSCALIYRDVQLRMEHMVYVMLLSLSSGVSVLCQLLVHRIWPSFWQAWQVTQCEEIWGIYRRKMCWWNSLTPPPPTCQLGLLINISFEIRKQLFHFEIHVMCLKRDESQYPLDHQSIL